MKKNHYSQVIEGICLFVDVLPPYSVDNREYTVISKL